MREVFLKAGGSDGQKFFGVGCFLLLYFCCYAHVLLSSSHGSLLFVLFFLPFCVFDATCMGFFIVLADRPTLVVICVVFRFFLFRCF